MKVEWAKDSGFWAKQSAIRARSEMDLTGVVGALLDRTVGTFELVAVDELVEGVAGDHVAADESHRRVVLGALLAQDRAGEDGVEVALAAQLDLDRQLVARVPDRRHLPLLHHLGEGRAAVGKSQQKSTF